MASVTINVLDPEFHVDPWQACRWLREEAPVYWDPVQGLWVISRHDDVLDVEKDTGRYCSSAGSRPLVDQCEDMSMINRDDPGHQEQRRLVSRRFTPVHAAGRTRPREPRARPRHRDPRRGRAARAVRGHRGHRVTPGWDVRHILDETILVLDGGAETTRTVIGSMIRELALTRTSAGSCSRNYCGGCRTGSWPAPASRGSCRPPSPAAMTGSASRSPRADPSASNRKRCLAAPHMTPACPRSLERHFCQGLKRHGWNIDASLATTMVHPCCFKGLGARPMLATAAPWTSPWLPPGYEQNFWNAA
jgi:hypothetical protein